jgi:hypothetical protein
MTEIVPWLNTVSMPVPARAGQRGLSKRGLQLALGVLWLVDAGLQFQPYMFSRQFITATIEPVAAGNPGIVARPIIWAAHLAAGHLALANAGFALIQLLIAAGLFYRRTVKIALATSIAWSVFVWWLGEGFGGLLTGASPLTGLPGAVILYALVAWLVWPAPSDQPGDQPRRLPAPALALASRLTWMALWALLGCYQLLPANRGASAVSDVFTGSASSEPAFIRALDSSLAAITAGQGRIAAFVLWALCVAAGVGVASWRLTRPALVLGGLLGALFWIAQGFGGIATGRATDPNSGPLLILLAACLWLTIRGDTPRFWRPASEKIGEGTPVDQEGGARYDIADHRSAPGTAQSDDRPPQRAPRCDDRAVRQPAAHPHRTWWHRQDPAGARGGGRGSGFLLPGRLLGRAGSGR